MRYQFIDSQHIQVVKHITHSGRRVVNPPDTLVDELRLGHAYESVDSPNLDDDRELKVSHEYVLDAGVIRDVWTRVEETSEEE